MMLTGIILFTIMALKVQGSPHLIVFGLGGKNPCSVTAYDVKDGKNTSLKEMPVPLNNTDDLYYATAFGGRWKHRDMTVAERNGKWLVIGGMGLGGMGWTIENGALKNPIPPKKHNEYGWSNTIAQWIDDEKAIVYGPSNFYEIYNSKTNTWMDIASNFKHKSSESHGVVYKDDFYVLTMGSMNPGRYLMKYNKETNEFEDLEPFPFDLPLDMSEQGSNYTVRLGGYAVAVFHDQLVACGGKVSTSPYAREKRAESAECRAYDFESKKWGKFPSLNVARGKLAMGVAAGKLHAVGGNAYIDRIRHDYDIVERYDQASKGWVKMPYTLVQRGALQLAIGVESFNKNTWYH